MAVDPSQGGVLYIGMRSVATPLTSSYFKSTDGGATWSELHPTLPGGGLPYLSIDPFHPGVLYVALQRYYVQGLTSGAVKG